MTNKIIILDSGHGGMINGQYMTDPKMGKWFKHQNGEIAYEGVINREIKDWALGYLKTAGFKTFDTCPTELDLPLSERCDIVNSICRVYGDENCLLISLHSNSGGGTGFEIWTSPGQNKSDEYASLYFDVFKKYFPNISMRKDISDGDVDKESKFYILMNTRCSSILPEFLFFDNFNDWLLLKETTTHQKYATMILDFVQSIK